LEQVDPRLARVVELRFFGGLSEEETGRVLGTTERTVRRDWIKARVFLHGHLST
jgi:DNA-directed RNA polymerase specialized sigma24 family protein